MLSDEDRSFLENRNIRLIEDDFVEIVDGFIRHSGEKVAKRLLEA